MKAVRVRRETRRLHHWPVIQLNVWLIVVLSASATCLGIFSWFMIVQSQMDLGTPWYVFQRQFSNPVIRSGPPLY